MKIQFLLLISTVFFIAGCGGEKPVADSKPSAQSTVDGPQKAQIELTVKEEVVPLANTDLDFSKQLQELSAEANKLQYEFKFAAAAEKWQEVAALMGNQFGTDSWQAINARVAASTASEQATFDETKIETLRAVFEKQQQVGQALRANNVAEALTLSNQSARITQDLFGADSFMMGKQMMQLARMNQQAGKLGRSTALYLKSGEILEAFLSDNHPDLEMIHAYLGENYLATSNYLQAIKNHTMATGMARELWGEGSLRYAARANDLGVAYYRNAELDSAAKILRAAESIRRGRLGANHPQVAHSLTNLGVVYLDQDRTEMADQCLSQAKIVFMEHYGVRHPLTIDCKSKLATVKMLLDDPQSAETLLVEVINGVQDTSNPRSTASLQYRLGIALAKQKKYTRAEPLLKSAMRLQKEALGDADLATVKTMKAYSRLLSYLDRQEEALALNEEIEKVAVAENSESNFRR